MPAQNTAAGQGNLLTSLLGVLGMSGVAGVLVAAMVTPLIAVVGVTANSTITLFENLPNYLDIKPLQQKTTLYAKQGGQDVEIAQFYAQNREEVTLDQISEYVQQAAVATEDPRFYQHGGVDVISATRALLASFLSDSGAGASTITMQYVRNVRVQTAESILDEAERDEAYRAATEVTTGRKLQEMRLAIGVDKLHSKEDILQGYLNISLFGGTVYGIESAAQYYFGKSAAELSLPESASLVAMVQEPNQYRLDIPENVPNNEERRNYVLRNMLEEGFIEKQEYEEAIATPVTPNIVPSNVGCQNAQGNTQYFCDYVRNVILQDPSFGATFEERLQNFQTKGYQIHTSLDLDAQANAQNIMSEAVPSYVEGVDLGSAVSMVEAGTGRILVMVQNTEFNETDEGSGPGRTSVNYNTDYDYGGSTGFQVGSTYKIFALAEWLAAGHSLNETINAQVRAFNLANFQDSCGPANGGSWSPQNDGGAKPGNVTAIQATAQSINTAYIAMAEKLDQCRIRDTAIALGAHRADGELNNSLPGAVLGTNEIAPLSMAVAVAGIANGGVSCSPIAIDSITLRDGTPVEAPKSDCKQALTPEVAAGVATAMAAVTSGGGTGANSNPGIAPLIGKTGTTDDAIHTWMVGASSKVGLAAWVGNASGQASMYNIGLPLAQASQTRHVLFRNVMGHAMTAYGGDAFPEPPESSLRPSRATIPDLTGRTSEEAKAVLTELGFSVSVGTPVQSAQPAGTVDHTIPAKGTQVDVGTTVTLYPSNGSSNSGTAVMPEVSGMTQEEAQAALGAAGFTGTIYRMEEASQEVPAGRVIRSDPAAGTPLPAGTEVKIYVSTG